MPLVTTADGQKVEISDDEVKTLREGYVPLERLNEATGKLRHDNERLAASLESLQSSVQNLEKSGQQNQQQQQPKEVTRAQLRAAVEAGQITQAQADDLWDEQQERKWESKMNQRVSEELSQFKQESQAESSVSKMQSTIADYSALLPAVAQPETEDRAKLQKEFNRLAKVMGQPKPHSKLDYQLQVIALENTFGSLDDVRARKTRKSTSHHETMEDVPTGQPSGGGAKPKSEALKSLSSKQEAHYQRAIDRGIYKSWADVEKELAFKRKKDR